LKHGAFNGAAANRDVARALASNDEVHFFAATSCAATLFRVAGSGSNSCHPGEREVLDGRSVHLLEGAITFPGIIAVVSGPGILQRFEKIGWTYSAVLSHQECR
jgi:hypothetical protein